MTLLPDSAVCSPPGEKSHLRGDHATRVSHGLPIARFNTTSYSACLFGVNERKAVKLAPGQFIVKRKDV